MALATSADDYNSADSGVVPFPVSPDPNEANQPEKPESHRRLVKEILRSIGDDKRYFEKPFKRMVEDMQMAMWGSDKDWMAGNNYRANIAGRHIQQKTASLYAKNPKAKATRRETLDFAIWDEMPETLENAFMTMIQAQQAAQQAAMLPPVPHPLTGMPVPQQPQVPPGYQEAMALMEDFQQGTERRKQIAKIGETLEILFAYYLKEQKPLDFKRCMKQVVRRTCTTGVGYIEIGFQREYGPRPGLTEQLADVQSRLDHLARLQKEVDDEDISEDDAEMAELEFALQSLQAEPEVVIREGLLLDAPQSTKVIPDRLTQSLIGFVGARHITIEYMYTPQEVEEIFKVDLKGQYRGYNADGKSWEPKGQLNMFDNTTADPNTDKGLVCVYKRYDKPSGLVYYVADGYPDFLREPAAPDVLVEDFWPIYALTFNAVESETELFPPSDVALLKPMQEEYNRSRQGLREHREAARPRWIFNNGAFEANDIERIQRMKPFDALGLNIDPQAKIADILQAMPVPGVDPNLYETGPIFTDTQLAVGSQEATFGGTSGATATESAIAANSSNSASQANVDDLDGFLTVIARASSQVLMREMSEDKVKEIVGPGAVWPEQDVAGIINELFLEVEAGSTGKPNQAVEVQNIKDLLPIIMQLPNINPMWIAKQVLTRFDDRLDLTDAIIANVPSIVSQNRMALAAPNDPNAQPEAQGAEGGANGPQPPEQGGSSAAFGNNQIPQ